MTQQLVRGLVCSLLLISLASPALAQVDLTGMWAPIFHEDQVERIPGPDVGDYAGLPINDAMRLRADSWDASLLTLPEHQCKPHPSTYGFRGVGNLRISAEVNDKTQSIIKLHTHIQWQEQKRDIWMDGRPHPPEYAAHTWQGFSTGQWEGNVLVVKTTHLKAGWIRRNGLLITDKATMTERFIRHGNYLTHVYMIEDPYYLTEPLIKTNGFQLVQNPAMQPYPCYPTVEVPREKGEVPHHLPGENPFVNEFAKKHNLPQNAVRGGAETALPEVMTGSGTRPSTSAQGAPSNVEGRDSGLGTRTASAGTRSTSTGAGRPEPGSRTPDPGPRTPDPGPRIPGPGPRIPDPGTDNEIHSLHVQGNVWMLTGGGVNAAVQIGDEGVLVVDTMTAALSDKLVAEIRKLAGSKPIRWIVNTHVDSDHTGGNAKVAEAGESIIAGNFAAQAGQASAGFAKILTHENVEARLVKVQPALPTSAMPTDTFFTDEFEMHFNGEAVQFIHVPNAHTDGDVMVFFRKSDVLVAGDAFNTNSFPVVDLESGGSLNGVVKTLNRMLDITVPEDKQEGGTYVIPGHGRLTDEADVVEYRDMMTIIRDRVQDAVSKGMTLEQVKAARLVRDYEGRYGAARGAASADAFVDIAYRSLKQ